MMKKRIARSAKALIFIVAAALLFSGFTTAGGTRLEKEAADLMLRRTEAMQRAMFHGGSDADIYSHLDFNSKLESADAITAAFAEEKPAEEQEEDGFGMSLSM